LRTSSSCRNDACDGTRCSRVFIPLPVQKPVHPAGHPASALASVLEWATSEGRVPLTQEARAIAKLAFDRLHATKNSAIKIGQRMLDRVTVSRGRINGFGVLVALFASGCVLPELWQTHRSQQVVSQYAYVEGTVASGSDDQPWMVVLISRLPCDDDWRALLAARDRGVFQMPPSMSVSPGGVPVESLSLRLRLGDFHRHALETRTRSLLRRFHTSTHRTGKRTGTAGANPREPLAEKAPASRMAVTLCPMCRGSPTSRKPLCRREPRVSRRRSEEPSRSPRLRADCA